MKLWPTPLPEPAPIVPVDVPVTEDPEAPILGSRGASTSRVGLPVELACAASMRSITPGVEADEVVVRNPPWSMKAKPDGEPEEDSSTPAGTSEAFRTLLPTT